MSSPTGNPRPNIVSAWFTPRCGRAELSTRIRLESAQTVTAIAEMPDGSVWRADKELTVNFGACADVGSGTPAEIRDFKPVSRVSVPKKAQRGEVVTIRALISHPMETGLRLDAFNLWVPLRIVEEFNCSFGGESCASGPIPRSPRTPTSRSTPGPRKAASSRSAGSTPTAPSSPTRPASRSIEAWTRRGRRSAVPYS